MSQPQISFFGERAIRLNWQAKIDPDQHNRLLHIESKLNSALFDEEILETVSTYHEILIYLSPKADRNKLVTAVKELINTLDRYENRKSDNWEIPVCYDAEFGIDLSSVAQYSGLSETKFVKLHHKPLYRIYFIGFLPGFLYLGGLSEKLHIPRKSVPSLQVPAGSVAIGGKQTGIYPAQSPGGWHIIGRSPVQLFDSTQTPPLPFKSGDYIKFIPISRNEYDEICTLRENGTYSLTKNRTT